MKTNCIVVASRAELVTEKKMYRLQGWTVVCESADSVTVTNGRCYHIIAVNL